MDRTTIAVEREVNDSLGRKKKEYGDRRRNETLHRLIRKDDQLWPWLRKPTDLKVAREVGIQTVAVVIETIGEDRASEIGFEAAFKEFENEDS